MITSSSPTDFAALIATHPNATLMFGASWCGPCQRTKPRVSALASELAATVIYIDVESHEEVASSFGVQTIPALFARRDGDVVGAVHGVLSVDELREVIAATE